MKSEFKKAFFEPVGSFTNQYGQDLSHILFSHQAVEVQYSEGRIAYRVHKKRERNQNVIKEDKRVIYEKNGRLYCETYRIDFRIYAIYGKGFIEGDHTKLVSKLSDDDKIRVEDIAMLSFNSNRMVHRKLILSVEEFIKLFMDR